MKPEELRIGNIVEYNQMRLPVWGILSPRPSDNEVYADKHIIEVFDGASTIDTPIDNIKPIELTEGWLEKFGFEIKSDGKYYHKEYERTWINLASSVVKYYGNATGIIKMIDSVHELQNVFYVLTGEELTIKNQ